jgi:hypothetical protein
VVPSSQEMISDPVEVTKLLAYGHFINFIVTFFVFFSSIGGPLAVRAGLSARSPYSKSKDKGKLMMDNMNSQFDAITAMAQHMENDFRNTRLVSYMFSCVHLLHVV